MDSWNGGSDCVFPSTMKIFGFPWSVFSPCHLHRRCRRHGERLEFSVSDFFCLTVESQIPVDLRQKEGIPVCRGMRMPLFLPAFERPCRRGMRLTLVLPRTPLIGCALVQCSLVNETGGPLVRTGGCWRASENGVGGLGFRV